MTRGSITTIVRTAFSEKRAFSIIKLLTSHTYEIVGVEIEAEFIQIYKVRFLEHLRWE